MNNKNKIFSFNYTTGFIVYSFTFCKKICRNYSSTGTKESATCLPATNSNQLTINNVRAYVETNGTMWFKEIAQYEVPRGSGKTSMFAAALWIGGRDVSGQLRLAAVRFRQNEMIIGQAHLQLKVLQSINKPVVNMINTSKSQELK